MTTTASYHSTSSPIPVVSWVLQQGNAAITCGIAMRPDSSFELSVAPSWSPRPSLVERYPGALAALERHAQVAGLLRDAGWHRTRSGQ